MTTTAPIRRGPILITSALAALGAAAIPAVALPALWRISPLYAMVFAALAIAELAAVIAVIALPDRRRTLLGGAAAGATLLIWALDRVLGVLPGPDPWQPADTVLGVTDQICAGLQIIAVLGLIAVCGSRPQRSRGRRIAGWAASAPLTLLVLVGAVVGVATASAGFAPFHPTEPRQLPAGRMSTVEYCRPAGIPLPMDLYTPPAAATRPAPVAVYVHGGGFMLGTRQANGLGASLANSSGALFTPLQQRLNTLGFVVASIDYRLAPAAPWPAPITDTTCAIRYLKAHATELGIDPNRIAAWGSSAGGTLVSLLGTTGPAAGFDIGQYPEQTSTVQAVVNMFGPTDFINFSDASGFASITLHLSLGNSTDTLRAASPKTYVTPGAPPFLILHGTEDALTQQSVDFTAQLHAAGVPATYIPVHGTGHQLDTPTQQPTPDQLTTTVVTFLTQTLHGPAQ
jgi:acetyl esterase/lipase